MRTFRLLGMALIAILVSVNFASCGSDDDEENNAYGVIITLRPTNKWHVTPSEDHAFWINEEKQDITYNNGSSCSLITEFRPFTKETYFYIVSICLGKTITSENVNEELIDKDEVPYEYKSLWEQIGYYNYIAYYDKELEDQKDGSRHTVRVFIYNKL